MKATHTLTGESVRIRPSDQTEGMRRRAAELALAVLAKEYPGEFGFVNEQDAEREHTLEALEVALEYAYTGFERCTKLARRGWEIDDVMVEILGDDYVGRAVREAIAAWVVEEGIEPSLDVGAVVRVPHEHLLVDGVVARIDRPLAQYLVRVPTLGHIELGSGGAGTLGFLLPFEVVEES